MAYSDRRPGLGVVVVVATLVLSLLWQAGPAYAVAGNIIGSLTDGANDPPSNVTWASSSCPMGNASYPIWRAFDNLATTHARCTGNSIQIAGQVAIHASFSGGYTPTITAARMRFFSTAGAGGTITWQIRCGITGTYVVHQVAIVGSGYNFDGIEGYVYDTGLVTTFNTAPCLSTDRIQFYNSSSSFSATCNTANYNCAWLEAEAYAVDPETPPTGSMAAIGLAQWTGSEWVSASSATWRPNDGGARFFAQFYDDVDCAGQYEWWWQVRRVDTPGTIHDAGVFAETELMNYAPYEDPDPPNNPEPPAEYCYIVGGSTPGGEVGTALIMGPNIDLLSLYGGRYFVDVGPRVGGVNLSRLGRGYFTLYDNSQAVGWRAVVPDGEGKLPIAAEEQCGLDIPCWLRSIWRAIIGLTFPEVVFPDFEWPEIEVPGFEVDYEPLIALLVGDAGPVEDGIVELFGGLESREPFYAVLAARERVLGTVESLADENTEASGACPTFMVGPFVFPEVEPQTYALELCFSDWGSSEAYRQVRALMGGVVWFGFALGLWRRFAPTLY